MMTAFISLWAIASFGLGQEVEAPSPSPRLAAVVFAMNHGFEIPRQQLVVANEVIFNKIFDSPRESDDRATKLPAEQTMADSAAIARLLGPSVRTGSAPSLVSCVKSACYSTTDAYVLVVDELKNRDPGINIRLYWPASARDGRYMLSAAVVETARSGNGWVGTRFTIGPTKGIVNIR